MAPISPSRFAKYIGQRSKKQCWPWPETSLFTRYTHDISSLWGHVVPLSCFVAQSFLLPVEVSWQCCYTNMCVRCATLGCCCVQRLQFTHTMWTRSGATSPTPLVLPTPESSLSLTWNVYANGISNETKPSVYTALFSHTNCPWASSGKQLTRTEKWLVI